MKDIITSKQNNIIKYTKSLQQKNIRDKEGRFFVEGYRIVKDAIDSDFDIEYIIFNENMTNDAEKLFSEIKDKLTYYIVSDGVFSDISDTKTPQGVLAVVNKKEYSLKDIIDKSNGMMVLLENIQDPGNMGTIIRTSDAAGADGIIGSKGSVDIYNPKVLRSTMGSIFHLPVVMVENFLECIDMLKSDQYNIFASHLKGSLNHFQADMKGKVGIIIGNEANGISDEVSEKCMLIKIPMMGRAESLNASVSAGILIYEYVRQRKNIN